MIPQLSDADEVLDGISIPDGVSVSVLIPNAKGLERALERRDRFHEVNVFLSASEEHNRRNVNRSVEESIERACRDSRHGGGGGPQARGRHLDVVRLPLRGRGSSRPA